MLDPMREMVRKTKAAVAAPIVVGVVLLASSAMSGVAHAADDCAAQPGTTTLTVTNNGPQSTNALGQPNYTVNGDTSVGNVVITGDASVSGGYQTGNSTAKSGYHVVVICGSEYKASNNVFVASFTITDDETYYSGQNDYLNNIKTLFAKDSASPTPTPTTSAAPTAAPPASPVPSVTAAPSAGATPTRTAVAPLSGGAAAPVLPAGSSTDVGLYRPSPLRSARTSRAVGVGVLGLCLILAGFLMLRRRERA